MLALPSQKDVLTERAADDASKLNALRSAAQVGVAALERGEFKGFEDIDELQTYLGGLSEKIISEAYG